MTVPFLDLRRRPSSDAETALARVLGRGQFVLGEEGSTFEESFAAYCDARHAVGVASGTDAITIALLAAGVEPGDEVVTAPNTCVPTIVGIERTGARPVLADVDPLTYTLDAAHVERTLSPRTRAIVPVHLYGQTADMTSLLALAHERGLLVIEDCAQAHGAEHEGRRAGSMGDAAAFSFYPTKNLGCLGDGGAILTGDDGIAERARLLRNYGERERFEHVLHGLNSRLDELQAAVLSVRLERLDAENDRRRALAASYAALLRETTLVVPTERPGSRHVHHLYVVQADARDELRARLAERGIGAAVHYPTPVHLQPAYRELGVPGGFPVAESLCSRVLSLPLSPDHTDEEVAEVAAALVELSAPAG